MILGSLSHLFPSNMENPPSFLVQFAESCFSVIFAYAVHVIKFVTDDRGTKDTFLHKFAHCIFVGRNKALGTTVDFQCGVCMRSLCLRGFPPPSSYSSSMHVRLIGDFKLAIVVLVCVGCHLFFFFFFYGAIPVVDWQTIQSVCCFSPSVIRPYIPPQKMDGKFSVIINLKQYSLKAICYHINTSRGYDHRNKRMLKHLRPD